MYLRLPYRWQFMARLAGQALPDITGNSRGNMSRDPHFDQILGVLAALGAGPEHVSAVAQAYMQRPGPEPAERAANTAPTCAKPTRHVSVGRDIPKCKIPRSLRQHGYLYKRGLTPMWYGRYRRPVRLPNGKYVLKPKNDKLGEVSHMTQADAWAKLRTIIDNVRTRTAPENDMTLKEFYVGYFKPEHMDKQAKATQDQSKSVFENYILPGIGDEELRSITLAQLQQLCDLTFAAGKTVTVERIKFGLSGLFRRAMAHRLIDFNPAGAIILPKMPHKVLRAPTLSEAQAFVATMVDPEYSPCREMALLAGSTSTNSAEMAGIPWRRVNLTDQPIIVEGQNLPPYSVAIWSNCNRGSVGPTKTKSRYRILPLGSSLVAVLSALKARIQFNGPDDLVFGIGKTPINYDVSLRKLKKAGKPAGIEVSWHDLRRFFANISDQIGMPEADRQYMMGHSSAAMTRHYTTTPAIERIRPYIEQITRALLAVGVTKTVTS